MTGKYKVLKNPKTDTYLQFKKLILSDDFPWFYTPQTLVPSPAERVRLKEGKGSTERKWDTELKEILLKDKVQPFNHVDHPWFSHTFLQRPIPERKYPKAHSPYLEMVKKTIDEILQYNNIPVNCYYRINVNLDPPIKGHKKNIPHFDHTWDHNVLIMYLTDAGGETVGLDNNLKKEFSFDPAEDSIMLFKGSNQLHCNYLPEEKRRVIVIMSFI
tara:strand:+ start:1040 stop:1684 length:645 start_codon:yes stop_codon:yes gene_type:complete